MHWLASLFIGLIIMAIGLWLVAYAPKLTDWFNQSPEYNTYFRIAGMVIIVVGVLFVFGIIGSTDVTDVSLAGQ